MFAEFLRLAGISCILGLVAAGILFFLAVFVRGPGGKREETFTTVRVFKSPSDIYEASAVAHQNRWGRELSRQPTEVILTDQNSGYRSNWDAWNQSREILNHTPSGWTITDRRCEVERGPDPREKRIEALVLRQQRDRERVNR